MAEIIAAVGVVAALVFRWLFSRGSQLRHIFSAAHLVEIAERLPAVKRAALETAEEMEKEIVPQNDPRVMITSARIVIFYTVSKLENSYSHHYSLKDQYGITAHAVGGSLILYIAHLLGVAPETLTLQRSEQHVYHAAFELSEEQQNLFVRTPVFLPEPDKAKAIFQECLVMRDKVIFHPTIQAA